MPRDSHQKSTTDAIIELSAAAITSLMLGPPFIWLGITSGPLAFPYVGGALALPGVFCAGGGLGAAGLAFPGGFCVSAACFFG